MAQLLRQLQAVADQTGVTLAAIIPTPLGENPSGPGVRWQVSITASGPHAAVRAYLAALRDLERLLVIEQIADNSPAGNRGADRSRPTRSSCRSECSRCSAAGRRVLLQHRPRRSAP